MAGLQFEFAAGQNSYPAEYDDALFFADYSRDCIWVMPKGAGRPAGSRAGPHLRRRRRQSGQPGDRARRRPLLRRLRRRHHPADQLHQRNQPPVAVATATPTTGAAPLTVAFDGSGPATRMRRHAQLRLGP